MVSRLLALFLVCLFALCGAGNRVEAKVFAGQKTASGVFANPPPDHAWESEPQANEAHRVDAVVYGETASGRPFFANGDPVNRFDPDGRVSKPLFRNPYDDYAYDCITGKYGPFYGRLGPPSDPQVLIDMGNGIAGILAEPYDYFLTAYEIYENPRSPWSYAGLIPLVPAVVGKVTNRAGDILNKVDNLTPAPLGPPSLVTNPGEAHFWSGLGRDGANSAADTARANNGTTLEMLLESRGIEMPAWDASNPAVVAAWKDASAAYARGASGDVRAVLGDNLRPGNFWEDVEKPALQANPNVINIIIQSPVTGP